MDVESKVEIERGEPDKGLDATIAREGKGMRHSEKRGWLWLAGSALVALMLSLPAHANAQTITLCVGSNGRVNGINLASCPGGTTTVSWQQFGPTGPAGATGPAGPVVEGAQGPVGPIGMTGPMGPTGAQGDEGGPGPANLIGGEGGPTGPTGPTGAQGPTGAMGATGVTGVVGPSGVNTEDVVMLSGGTLGNHIGTLAGIQAEPTESDTIAPGNGAQIQGHLQAETFVPIPANPNTPTAGVLQDFHFAINPGPGGTAGAYNFFVCDLTTDPTCAVSPPGTPICTITQGLVTPGMNGTNINACPDPTHTSSCTCENDEQSGPGTEVVGVSPGDSVAIIVTTSDNSGPTNDVNVRFTMNYVHDDQN